MNPSEENATALSLVREVVQLCANSGTLTCNVVGLNDGIRLATQRRMPEVRSLGFFFGPGIKPSL